MKLSPWVLRCVCSVAVGAAPVGCKGGDGEAPPPPIDDQGSDHDERRPEIICTGQDVTFRKTFEIMTGEHHSQPGNHIGGTWPYGPPDINAYCRRGLCQAGPGATYHGGRVTWDWDAHCETTPTGCAPVITRADSTVVEYSDETAVNWHWEMRYRGFAFFPHWDHGCAITGDFAARTFRVAKYCNVDFPADIKIGPDRTYVAYGAGYGATHTEVSQVGFGFGVFAQGAFGTATAQSTPGAAAYSVTQTFETLMECAPAEDAEGPAGFEVWVPRIATSLQHSVSRNGENVRPPPPTPWP